MLGVSTIGLVPLSHAAGAPCFWARLADHLELLCLTGSHGALMFVLLPTRTTILRKFPWLQFGIIS
jgi:hypothetical protein